MSEQEMVQYGLGVLCILIAGGLLGPRVILGLILTCVGLVLCGVHVPGLF